MYLRCRLLTWRNITTAVLDAREDEMNNIIQPRTWKDRNAAAIRCAHSPNEIGAKMQADEQSSTASNTTTPSVSIYLGTQFTVCRGILFPCLL